MNNKQNFFFGILSLSIMTLHMHASEQQLHIKLPQQKEQKNYHDLGLEQFKKIEFIGGTHKQFKKVAKKQLQLEAFEHHSINTTWMTKNNKKQHQKMVQSIMTNLRHIKFPKTLTVTNPQDYDTNIEKTFKFVAYMQALQRRLDFNYPHYSKELKQKYDQLIEHPLKALTRYVQNFNGEPDPLAVPTSLQFQLQCAQNQSATLKKSETPTLTQIEKLLRAQQTINYFTELQLDTLSTSLMNKFGLNKKRQQQKHFDTELITHRCWANECILQEAKI